ncbi:hypothetical protein [Streptomyces sp. NPDC059862]|uniref:hypothetical protein n=1 Tax=unclassified Streptomyces TaxID=2593676 RepID=UPI00362EBD80
MKRSAVVALASISMMLATGMASTAYTANDPDPANAVAPQKPAAPEADGHREKDVRTYVGAPVDLQAGDHNTATAQCPPGEVATGGGGRTTGTDENDTFLTDSFPTDSAGSPSANGSTPTGWSVSAKNTVPEVNLTSTLQAYVVCLEKNYNNM